MAIPLTDKEMGLMAAKALANNTDDATKEALVRQSVAFQYSLVGITPVTPGADVTIPLEQYMIDELKQGVVSQILRTDQAVADAIVQMALNRFKDEPQATKDYIAANVVETIAAKFDVTV